MSEDPFFVAHLPNKLNIVHETTGKPLSPTVVFWGRKIRDMVGLLVLGMVQGPDSASHLLRHMWKEQLKVRSPLLLLPCTIS